MCTLEGCPSREAVLHHFENHVCHSLCAKEWGYKAHYSWPSSCRRGRIYMQAPAVINKRKGDSWLEELGHSYASWWLLGPFQIKSLQDRNYFLQWRFSDMYGKIQITFQFFLISFLSESGRTQCFISFFSTQISTKPRLAFTNRISFYLPVLITFRVFHHFY